MKRVIIGTLVAAFSAVFAQAQNDLRSSTISPYSQYGLGLLADPSQGVCRAMGGTGLGMRGGTLVNTLNPASYSAVDSLTMLFDVGLSGRLSNFKEGNVSANTRSANFDYAVGLFRMKRNLGVSFGLLPFSDVGYSYTTSTYLNSTIGSISEQHTGSGGFHQAFVGAGWKPFKPLSVGVNFSYLWGSYSRSVMSVGTTSVNSLSKSYDASVSNYLLSFGMQWQQPLGRKDNLTLGATLGLRHNLHADPSCSIVNINTSTLVSDTTKFVVRNGLEVPVSYGVGLAWQHGGRMTVAADVTKQKWSSVSMPLYDEKDAVYTLHDGYYSDRTRYSLGVDYVPNPLSQRGYFKHVHYRFGASYTTPYYKINGSDGPKEMGISAGLGLPLLRTLSELNISAQWLHTSADNMITDNTIRINVGLTFNERWFAKLKVN